MSLLFVVEKARHAGPDAWVDPSHPLSVVSTGAARWFDPSAQHVTWGLRVTNAGDHPISDLAASFTYSSTCGSSAELSLTSTSARGGAIRSWGPGRSLARTYPGTIAAWETLLVTGVFTSTSNAGGSLSVSFGVGPSDLELATLSADF